MAAQTSDKTRHRYFMAASAGIDPTSFVGVKRKMVHALRSGAATSDGRAGSFVTPLAGVAFVRANRAALHSFAEWYIVNGARVERWGLR
jgi:hypothetical protein